MDLSECVVVNYQPGPRRTRWMARFQEVIESGLAGEWINATKAWGVSGHNVAGVRKAGEVCELTVEAHSVDGDLYLRVK